MKIKHAGGAANASDVRAGGGSVKSLLFGEQDAPDNYVLRYSCGEEGGDWSTPRHRHVFDQVRYVLEGDYSIGKNRVLPAGWVGYFPESAYYGPQVMSPNLRMVVLQFGGPSGRGFYSTPQRVAAMSAMKTSGTFTNGVYHWVDEDGGQHNQDAGEAVWERIFGGRVDYPPKRYDEIILMNPENFGWIADEAAPGVAYRRLGTFSERDIRIGFVQLEAGASLDFGTEKAAEVMFLAEGSVSHDGEIHAELTGFSSGAGDAPQTLVAVEPAKFFYTKLPTF
jgi:hypothetical protein